MKPKVLIVDDQDKVIGSLDRRKIREGIDIFRCSALWLTNSKGDVLIAQRHHTKAKEPNKWGPAVAGTVEHDETYESNIYKEAEEEIGLSGVKFVLGPKLMSVGPRKQWIQLFTAKLDRPESEFRLQEDEVEKVAWVPKEELIKDVAQNPGKYVPSMQIAIDLIYPK